MQNFDDDISAATYKPSVDFVKTAHPKIGYFFFQKKLIFRFGKQKRQGFETTENTPGPADYNPKDVSAPDGLNVKLGKSTRLLDPKNEEDFDTLNIHTGYHLTSKDISTLKTHGGKFDNQKLVKKDPKIDVPGPG